MQVDQAGPTGWISYAVTAVIVGVVLAIRLRRINRARPLKLGRLWVVPAIYAALVALVFAAQPPSTAGWAAATAGTVIGAALGWWRGRTVRIHVDPETGELNQTASLAGLAILGVLVLAKAAASAGGVSLHLDVATWTAALLGFALGALTAMRVELYVRARRLIGLSRAAGATPVL